MPKATRRQLSPQDVDAILLANVIRKAKSGRPLTKRDEERLTQASGSRVERAEAIQEQTEDAAYVSKAQFERWLKTQGVKISHQNLYKSYLSPSASNPAYYNQDGTKVDKWKTLGIIRAVQANTITEPVAASARRRDADIRSLEARMEREVIALNTLREERIHVRQVQMKWRHFLCMLSAGTNAIIPRLPAEHHATVREQYAELLGSLAGSDIAGECSSGSSSRPSLALSGH